jgi:hypothetical protein
MLEIGGALRFPDFHGRSLDAFDDLLGDIEIPYVGGIIVVFDHFDTFARHHECEAQALLDIFADNGRRHLLLGKRLLLAIQTDDYGLTFAEVGATPVMWNPAEWTKGPPKS